MASAAPRDCSAESQTTKRGSHSGSNLALKRQNDSICMESDMRRSTHRSTFGVAGFAGENGPHHGEVEAEAGVAGLAQSAPSSARG